MLTGKTIGELTQLTGVDGSTKFLVESGSATYYSNYSDIVDGFATTGSNSFTGTQTINGTELSTEATSSIFSITTHDFGDISLYAEGGNVSVTGSLAISNYLIGNGALGIQPDITDIRYISIYNTDETDTHIVGNASYTFFGDDDNYVKIDSVNEKVVIDAISGVTIDAKTTINSDTNVRGNLKVNAADLEYLPLNIISGQTQFRGGQIDFMTGGTAVFHSTIAMIRDDIATSSVQLIPWGPGSDGSGAGTLFIGASNVAISGPGGTKYVQPTIATLMVSGSMYLEPYDGDGSQTGSALPSSGQRGSIAVSGSNLFFHNGTMWKQVTLT
jgi:hypothetical protein